ncbi:allantoate amidohydrolase [Cellulomonas soli]|uniref:allantoate amidohydrolase n=1 Tax=Cellulomonas soli TaxID=931535 RepID=UPI003F85D231
MSTALAPETAAAFRAAWRDLAPVGRATTGGYQRLAWTPDDLTLREWFAAQVVARGLDLVEDRAGNQWAWWGDPDADGPGVVTGSHLDSVPGGGAFDGPLGVVSALAVVDELRARGVRPARPLGVVCFTEEEGGRFGVACAGSRVLTGVMSPDRALGLRDTGGTTLADALRAAGRDPSTLGPDPQALARVGSFVELHVEQGRALVHTGDPVGVGRAIWPHGRWRVDLHGRGDHAGTTPLADRDDPMLALAALVQEVRIAALEAGALATVGKVVVEPNGVNAIPSLVRAWLDVRADEEPRVRQVLDQLRGYTPVEESWTGPTVLDADLSDTVAAALGDAGLTPPTMSTGAGHDAGILAAAGVPTTMLFVRNPTGVSHDPAEDADEADCLVGVGALAAALTRLVGDRSA